VLVDHVGRLDAPLSHETIDVGLIGGHQGSKQLQCKKKKVIDRGTAEINLKLM